MLARLTEAMAVLEPELAESDGALLASTLLETARQRCLIVLLTDLNSTALELGLLPRIPLLASRHRLLVAAVAVPGSPRWRQHAVTRRRSTRLPRPSGRPPSAPG